MALSFIDMTSHELRNPLSAVVQCADSVIASLQQMSLNSAIPPFSEVESTRIQEAIKTSIEALEIIVSCSLHQKRVIDDVLTLSKLDSNLILITPM
jgi:signal transduction histidine kinase